MKPFDGFHPWAQCGKKGNSRMTDVKHTKTNLQDAALSGPHLAVVNDAVLYPQGFYCLKDLRDESERNAAIVD
jgi:hypothetical protein